MKTYTIIGGVNGVGKSSLTGVLLANLQDLGYVIDVDKITAQCNGDKITGGKKAIKKINDCIDKGISFTQETTLSGRKTLETIKKAIDQNYKIRLFYVGVGSLDESLARIANRVKKGGHDIPTSDVQRRYATRFENLMRILPYCNQAEFYDNENGFVKVAKYENGSLFFEGAYMPTWLLQFESFLHDAEQEETDELER